MIDNAKATDEQFKIRDERFKKLTEEEDRIEKEQKAKEAAEEAEKDARIEAYITHREKQKAKGEIVEAGHIAGGQGYVDVKK